MEFFELGIERIHKMISMCLSLAMERGLLFGLSALLIGIVAVLLCKKLKLFHRNNNTLQLLTRTYYVYIPMVFMLGGIAIGATMATAGFFEKETKSSISPLMKFIFPAYQSHVNINWARVTQTNMTFSKTVEEYVSKIKFLPRDSATTERFFTKAANMMVPKITKWGIESVVGSAKDIALKQSEEQGYLETSKVKALLIVHTMSMFNYPPGLWEETNLRLEDKIAYFFKGVIGNIYIIFSILLLFPVIETIIYHIFKRGKKSTPQHTEKAKNVLYKQNGYHLEIVEEMAKEEVTTAAVDMEIPKFFEN